MAALAGLGDPWEKPGGFLVYHVEWGNLMGSHWWRGTDILIVVIVFLGHPVRLHNVILNDRDLIGWDCNWVEPSLIISAHI